MYILLDKTLSNPQKVVQSSHLSLESTRILGPFLEHPSIIVLKIKPQQIEDLKKYLDLKEIKHITFYENLLKKITGIATIPLTKEEGKLLQHLAMLKDEDFKENL